MTRSVLDIDDAEYVRMMRLAVAQAIALSLEADFLDEETRVIAVERAARAAANVAVMGQLEESTLNMSDAERAVYTALTSGPAPAAAASSGAAPAHAEAKKEEKNEEDAAEGLGNLFG